MSLILIVDSEEAYSLMYFRIPLGDTQLPFFKKILKSYVALKHKAPRGRDI